MQIVYNLFQHDITKHIDVYRYLIKYHIDKIDITFLFLDSKDQVANVLTKAICNTRPLKNIFNDQFWKF